MDGDESDRDDAEAGIEAGSSALDEKLAPVDLGLAYLNQICSEVIESDQLCIIARGLGMYEAVSGVIYVADSAGTHRNKGSGSAYAPENLILIIGASARDFELFLDAMKRIDNNEFVTRGLQRLNAETGGEKRQELYHSGGVYMVTARILIVDLLDGTLDPAKLTGLVTVNAHKVYENSVETFCIDLIRYKNSACFLKAFTDEPISFTKGFNSLANRLRYLGTPKVSLWPRFRYEVDVCIKQTQVEEIILEMDSTMVSIQTLLTELIQAVISDIKRRVTDVDTESWTVDAALSGDLHRTVTIQLTSVYHRLSPDGKQSVRDLGELQTLVQSLSTWDPAEFLVRLEVIKTTSHSPWLMMPAADALFEVARERVENEYGMPKWPVLTGLLDELGKKRILIMASSFRSSLRVRDLLVSGEQLGKVLKLSAMLRIKRYKSIVQDKATTPQAVQPQRGPPSKRRRIRGGHHQGVSRRDAAKAPVDDQQSVEPDVKNEVDIEELDQIASSNCFYYDGVPITLVRSSNGIPDFTDISTDGPEIVLCHYDFPEVLHKMNPDVVIMYEPDLSFLRELEVYRTLHESTQVFFMYYQRSVEEMRYLSVMRQEKDAFSSLIREKGNMAMEIKDEPKREALRVTSTRIAGGRVLHKVSDEPQKIVVDIREFRSALPYLIWKESIEVIPATLIVGDYVLSPDIVVERKSVNDLLSSFRDGRLFEQCEKMFAHYSRPILLIEFDNDKSFSLEQFREIRVVGVQTQETIRSRLSVLLILYPKLKIIWSASPRHTAELFRDLKGSQKEPDLSSCAQAGRTVLLNNTAMKILRAIPGVTAAGATKIAEKLPNLAALADLPIEELSGIVGPEAAGQITRFLDAKLE